MKPFGRYGICGLCVLVILFFSCDMINGPGGDPGPGGPGPGGDDFGQWEAASLSFDLTGAAAIGAAEVTGSDGEKAGDSAFGLVKVLEDGSIEMAMKTEGNLWLPPILFIATSPVEGNKDLYVAFNHSIRFWDEEQQSDVSLGSFLHIKADGSYKPIISDDAEGRVVSHSWWGSENFKPITFDSEGNFYFAYEFYNGETTQVLYKYDISTNTATNLTAKYPGHWYQSFEVSPDGSRLFVMGEYGKGYDDRFTFFRMYSTADVSVRKTIYYSAGQDVWVRGYKISPDGNSVIMNGWNIRGINGILRADIVSNTEIKYTPLYDSRNDNTGFNPIYHEWYDEWEGKEVYQGLFDEIEKWRIRVLMTDKTQFKYVAYDELTWTHIYETWDEDAQQNVWVEESAADQNRIWVWDHDAQTGQDIDIGTTWYFATNASDPTQYAAETTFNSFKGSGKTPIYKMEWWKWTKNGEQILYKDVPQKVMDFFETTEGKSVGRLYIWDEHWYTNQSYSSGTLDADAIMKYLGSYYISDVDFKYDVWVNDSVVVDINDTNHTILLNEAGKYIYDGKLFSNVPNVQTYIQSTTPQAKKVYLAALKPNGDIIDVNDNITNDYSVADFEPKKTLDNSTLYVGAQAFTKALQDEPYLASEIGISRRDASANSWKYLEDHIVEKNTVNRAKTFQEFKDENNLPWLDFQEVRNLFFDSNNQLWGILKSQGRGGSSKPTPIKLLDSTGKRALSTIDLFKDDENGTNPYLPVGFVIDGDYMYFRNQEVDWEGYPVEAQKLYRFQVTNPTNVENVLQNVPENANMLIMDFSIGGGWLYFTAINGTEVIGGKVSLTSLEYAPFTGDYNISQLEVY